MGLLRAYEPPAFLPDFDGIPGQREAWHRFLSTTFDYSIERQRQKYVTAANGGSGTVQFYNAATYDPGGPLIEQAVVWNAFPKELLRRFGRERALIEADRLWPLSAYEYDPRYDPDRPWDTGAAQTGDSDTWFYRPTVEYCEWHVNRDPSTGRIVRVTFTSEPPEYWQAMFGDTIQIDTGYSGSFPGDKNLVLQRYKELVDPSVEMDDLLVQKDGFGFTRGQYNIYNKWNTTHGIMHLCAPPNAITAEVILGADATISYEDGRGNPVVDPDALICGTGIGGPNRNSDPTIAGTVNALARLGAMVTLVNPVGLYMDHIDFGGWEVPGGVSPQDCVRIVRGREHMIERLVVEVPGSEFDVSAITIGGMPIIFGGQIAECITVKLVGAAAAINTVKNGRLTLPIFSSVDPANAKEIFGRGGKYPGTIRAFEFESGEIDAGLLASTCRGR
jgi:hypothetical protein